ncbi:MAG TPA: hypothetical protein VJ694_04900, partial [Patescibacteria group bacterium]|nr:hypothetical protein [Patescibacteria group bacterium]
MTPRKRAALIIGLFLLLVAVIVFAVMYLLRSVPQKQQAAVPEVDAPVIEAPSPTDETVEFVNPLIATKPASPGATGSRQMAELFAERYGSYSNQGDYQNLRDLLPVMTERYRKATEAFLATVGSASGQTFEGVTSVKVSTDMRSLDDDSAVIAVTLQQERTSGTAGRTVGYRTLRME